jgi:hypothetical protein
MFFVCGIFTPLDIRATRALDLADVGHVLLWGGAFWRVTERRVRAGSVFCTHFLEPARRRAKTLDDCTPAEWSDANRAAMARTYK